MGRRGGRRAVPARRAGALRLPLKALNNDVERNLQRPLHGMREEARRRGAPSPPLRVGVRTGDTPPGERQRMVKRPPHILITTPESLYLMLTAERSAPMFATTHTVIVDEIHTLVGTKRGAHLALSLERLERLTREGGGAGAGAGAGEPAAPADRAERHGAAAGGGGPLPRRAGARRAGAAGPRRRAR